MNNIKSLIYERNKAYIDKIVRVVSKTDFSPIVFTLCFDTENLTIKDMEIAYGGIPLISCYNKIIVLWFNYDPNITTEKVCDMIMKKIKS